MTDAPAFFRAIEANLDDDTPRLVFADWLDENAGSEADHARAEFIRSQVECARESDAARRSPLELRQQQILDAHAQTWASAWPTKLYYPKYYRGFLDPIYIGTAFVRSATHLAELMPLFHLRLFKARIVMKALVALPELEFVRRLTMTHNVLRNADMTALVASPHLGNLQELDLSDNQIGIRGVASLAVAKWPALRVLRLAHNPVKDRGLLALTLTGWPALEHLDLTSCGLSGPGVIGLAGCYLALRLTSLQLSNNEGVSADAWVTLARARLERLHRLDLSNPNVTDEVAEALTANAALANLRVLHMGGSSITARGARAILNSPHLRGLTRLRLPESHLDATLHKQLRAAFGAAFNP